MKETKASMQRSENVVSLSSLFWAVLSKWRIILCCTLALGFLFGAVKGFQSFKQQRDPDYLQSVLSHNEYVNLENSENLSRIENEIDRIKLNLEKQKSFSEESELMQIFPYEMYRITNTYFVDSGYELLLENVYQNPDPTAAIVNGYASKLNEMNAGSMQYFRSVDTGKAGNGILQISVYGQTQKQAEERIAAVEAALEESKPILDRAIHEHKLILLGSESSMDRNNLLEEFQREQTAVRTELTRKLDEAIGEYNNFRPSAVIPVGLSVTVKTAVKNAVVGAVLGAFVSCVFFLLLFLLGDRILDPEDVLYHFGKTVFGVFGMGRRAGWLDAQIESRQGISPPCGTEDSYSLLAASIQNMAEQGERVFLVGSMDEEKLRTIAEKLLATGEIKIELIPCGNIKTNIKALHAVRNAESIVCVEELGVTTRKMIRSELGALSALEKSCAGFILINRI